MASPNVVVGCATLKLAQKSILFSKLSPNNNSSNQLIENQFLANKPVSSNSTNSKVTETTDFSFAKKLSQISNISKEKNNLVIVNLPANNISFSSANKLNENDYNQALAKTMFQQVGLLDVTNTEINSFQQKYSSLTKDTFGLKNSLSELNKHTVNKQIKIYVSDYDYKVINVGKQDILAQRQALREEGERAYQAGTKYVDDAMKGHIANQLNAPINLANGILEPVRGIGVLVGLDIPKIPRLETAEKSEYWQKDGRIVSAEFGSTLALGLFAGKQISDKLLQTKAGQVFTGVEASYNIGTGAAGVDPTERGTNGQYREMGYLERSLRIVGGGLTAYGLSESIDDAASSLGQSAKSTLGEGMEALTPEGFSVSVPNKLDSSVKQAEDLNILARSPEEVARAKKINDVLEVSKKEQVVHGGSIDRTTFRQKIHEAEFFNHNNKHLKAKTEEQAKQFSQTGGKEAQYLPSVNNKVLEKETMWNSLNTGLFVKKADGETFYFYHKFDESIGYNLGKPTKWVRAELSGGDSPVYHGHPVSIQEVRKHFPDVKE